LQVDSVLELVQVCWVCHGQFVLSRHKARPRCRHRRQMVGVLQCLLIHKGVGKRMVVDRQKVKTRSESNRYRRAGRFKVRAGRKVVQSPTVVRTGKTSKRE
jgi:hypothetical protein